jgi:glycerol kinase
LRPEIIETTALGAAYLAGLAVGFWESIDAISSQWRVSGSFVPQKNDEWRKTKLGLWHKAVKAVLHWTRES